MSHYYYFFLQMISLKKFSFAISFAGLFSKNLSKCIPRWLYERLVENINYHRRWLQCRIDYGDSTSLFVVNEWFRRKPLLTTYYTESSLVLPHVYFLQIGVPVNMCVVLMRCVFAYEKKVITKLPFFPIHLYVNHFFLCIVTLRL